MSFLVMFRKEWTELVRSYRVLLIPILFLLIGMMGVVVTKLTPQMISSAAGNLPPGAVIKLPPPTASDAAQKLLSQFDFLGIVSVILLFMGSFASERASGVMTMLLVKPVTKLGYVGAKAVSAMGIVSFSYGFTMLVSWFYIQQLFNHGLSNQSFVLASLVYLPKLLLLVAVVLFCSAVSRNVVLAGGISLVVFLLMSVLNTSNWLKTYGPTNLSGFAEQYMTGDMAGAVWPITSSLLLLILLFTTTCLALARRSNR